MRNGITFKGGNCVRNVLAFHLKRGLNGKNSLPEGNKCFPSKQRELIFPFRVDLLFRKDFVCSTAK